MKTRSSKRVSAEEDHLEENQFKQTKSTVHFNIANHTASTTSPRGNLRGTSDSDLSLSSGYVSDDFSLATGDNVGKMSAQLIQSAVDIAMGTSSTAKTSTRGLKRTLLTIDPETVVSSALINTYKVRRTTDLAKDVMSRTTGLHTPSLNRQKDGKDHRRRCRVCKVKKTDLICYECTVPLCITSHGMDNCWYIFHNCENIQKPPATTISTALPLEEEKET